MTVEKKRSHNTGNYNSFHLDSFPHLHCLHHIILTIINLRFSFGISCILESFF